jgi:hypothetical protein
MTAPIPPSPPPQDLLARLRDREVLLVTSRDESGMGTVPMGFALSPAGVVYLLTSAFSRKAQRWERDDWVRLSIPGGGAALEGSAHRMAAGDIDPSLAALLVARFGDSGAATPESLRQMLDTGVHVLLRVDGIRRAG